MKAFRTSVHPVYHKKQMIINAAGFGGHLNFNNTRTQFEWMIIPIQPQIKTEHRNLYTTFGNEQTNHLMKEMKYLYSEKIFKNHRKNLRPWPWRSARIIWSVQAYISSMASTKNALFFVK